MRARRQFEVGVLGLAALALLGGAVGRAKADVLIGISPKRLANGPDTVVSVVNPHPFSVIPIGAAGVPALSGLTLEPGTNTLFAASGLNGAHPGSLFTLNSTTGAATLIGPTGSPAVTALAFGANGTLFGAGSSSTQSVGDELIRINPATGAGTLVGPFGAGIDGMAALALNPRTGVLYGGGGEFNGNGNFTNLFTIDPTTGAATLIGPLLPDAQAGTTVLTGLTFDSAGTLFGSFASGNPASNPASAAQAVITIDLPTQSFTTLGQTQQLSDLVAVPVPEPSTLALLALGGGALAGWRRWKKRATA
jgi:PEP-CTERM motif